MIVIVDYSMGNLRSVQKALEQVGHAATISGDPAVVRQAAKLILPGVGAFGDAMRALAERRLIEPLCEAAAGGKPLLGICLGLQLLFETGYEDGRHEGLGILPGEVVRFAAQPGLKIPHMGWNQLRITRPAPHLAGLADGVHMYFVHSYYVVPRDRSLVAAETDYPAAFASAVWRDNLFATQFHPEKSQAEGLKILRNFAAL